jgi:hypothetical protein
MEPPGMSDGMLTLLHWLSDLGSAQPFDWRLTIGPRWNEVSTTRR